MATQSKGDIRDLMECSICMEPFKKPKGLPCIHTFCMECLEKYGEEERPGDKMTCPTCRQMFKIPSGGFKNLPNNIFIEQIAANEKCLQDGSSKSKIKCEVCNNADASHYCVACAESMCGTCSVTHSKLKATRSHKVVSQSEKEGSQVYTRARPTYCDTHTDKQLELYCYDCSKTICLVCSAVEHKTHLCADLQTALKKFCDELKQRFPHLEQSIDVITSEKKLLENSRTSLSIEIEACERSITERGDELKRHVDWHCNQLLNHLRGVYDEELKKIQTRMDDVDRQLLILTSFKTYVEELTTNGSACAISQSAKDLLARANELQNEQAEFSKGCLGHDSVSFKPQPVPDVFSGPSTYRLFGFIAVNEYPGEKAHVFCKIFTPYLRIMPPKDLLHKINTAKCTVNQNPVDTKLMATTLSDVHRF